MDEKSERGLVLQVASLTAQCFALRNICAEIMAEISVRSPDPAEALELLNGAMTGFADGIAQRVSDPSPFDVEVTRIADAVQSLARGALRRKIQLRRNLREE